MCVPDFPFWQGREEEEEGGQPRISNRLMEGKKVSYPFSRPPASMPSATTALQAWDSPRNTIKLKLIFLKHDICFWFQFFSFGFFPESESVLPGPIQWTQWFLFFPFPYYDTQNPNRPLFCEPFVGIREVGFEIVRPLKKWEKEKAENWPELSVLWTLHEKRSVLLSKGAIIQTFFSL